MVAICGQQSGFDRYGKLIDKEQEAEQSHNVEPVGRLAGQGHQHGHRMRQHDSHSGEVQCLMVFDPLKIN
jgi:hypothetical protein